MNLLTGPREAIFLTIRAILFRFLNLVFFLALILAFLHPSNVHSAQVTLSWDRSTDVTLAGYKVHYGTSSGSYSASIDVGNVTTCTISSLPEGITLFFAAIDYNTSGIESGYSNEVVYNPPPACSYSILPTTQSYNSSGGPGTVSVTAQAGCTWTANSNASWVIVTSNSTGTGTQTVHYSVSPNSGAGSRSGTVMIAGKTFTVNQSGGSQYSLTVVKAGAGSGTVTTSPAGTTFDAGTVVTLTGKPEVNSLFSGWSGGCSGTSPTCTVTMNSNASVTAAFALKEYTITASAGENGSVSPSGAVTVSYGTNQSFTISPARGCQIADVAVDGVSVGRTKTYVFENVTADHTIDATFRKGWILW